MPDRPTTVALYLPQFHPVPENDGWFGPGFTEWHNVVRARPLFQGHEQPHLPREFGFYDLRVPEVLDAQARAARAAGIDAFCFHHYWFEGHRPLHAVLDRVLSSGTPHFPFCLCWANENWSRHWDAGEHEVLLRQRYSPEDDEAHGRFLLRALTHPLYLRVDGVPVLFIYRMSALPDPQRTLKLWREMWQAEGLDEVHVVMFETFGNHGDPRGVGADSSAQFIPHGIFEHVPRVHLPDTHGDNAVLDYATVAERYLSIDPPSWRRHENVVPGWDNSPRRGDGRSLMIRGRSPELYERWLRAVHDRTPHDGLVIINAWNEWAEGAHLEPDLSNGDAYLRATARALRAPVAPDQAEIPLLQRSTPVRDHFADLYLDVLASETQLRRRLSRLEATLERQIDVARYDAFNEAAELRENALKLVAENQRLKQRLSEAGFAQ